MIIAHQPVSADARMPATNRSPSRVRAPDADSAVAASQTQDRYRW
jgi:hypothetical protein